MLSAVTNRKFPMLEQSMERLFGIPLEHDPELTALARMSRWSLFTRVRKDPAGRIRIIFVDGTEDLSAGWARDRDVIGQNFGPMRLILVAVPEEFDFTLDGCHYIPESLDGYLLAVTLHELYEILTGDLSHCRNPGLCVNSRCRMSDKGYCCLCMGGLIDRKWPDLALEDVFCEEDLGHLRRALGR